MSDMAKRPGGQIIVYRTDDGRSALRVRLEDEIVWLPQAQMADLFEATKQNVSLQIRNILAEGELQADSVVKEYLTTAADGCARCFSGKAQLSAVAILSPAGTFGDSHGRSLPAAGRLCVTRGLRGPLFVAPWATGNSHGRSLAQAVDWGTVVWSPPGRLKAPPGERAITWDTLTPTC